jgi:hypothetical protein
LGLHFTNLQQEVYNVEMAFIHSKINGAYAPGVERLWISATGNANLNLGQISVVDGLEQFFCRRGQLLGRCLPTQGKAQGYYSQEHLCPSCCSVKKETHGINGGPKLSVFVILIIIPNPIQG